MPPLEVALGGQPLVGMYTANDTFARAAGPVPFALVADLFDYGTADAGAEIRFMALYSPKGTPTATGATVGLYNLTLGQFTGPQVSFTNQDPQRISITGIQLDPGHNSYMLYAMTDGPLNWLQIWDAKIATLPFGISSGSGGAPLINPVLFSHVPSYAIRFGTGDGWADNPVNPLGDINAPALGVSLPLHVFGGNPDEYVYDTTAPSGAGYDTVAPGTDVFQNYGHYGVVWFSATLKAEGGVTATLSLVDLSGGAPDTPIVSLTGSGSATGELASNLSAAPIVLAHAHAVKLSTSDASKGVTATGIQLFAYN